MGTNYTTKSETIGASKVVVPDYFFKIIIDMMDLTQVYAFSFPKITPTANLNDYKVSILTIESTYKIKFPNYPVDKNIVNTMPTAPQPYEYLKYRIAKCKNTPA
jgi:DNA/RNA endonuclease G (NUC1)